MYVCMYVCISSVVGHVAGCCAELGKALDDLVDGVKEVLLDRNLHHAR